MREYAVSGRFKSRTGWSDFTTTIEAESERVAEEHAYATLGGRHGLKRSQIELDAIDEV